MQHDGRGRVHGSGRAWAMGLCAAGVVGAITAGTHTRIEQWGAHSRVMQTAARYLPHAAGMVGDIDTGSTSVARSGLSARARWNLPMSQAWPAERAWTPELEAEYERFVAAIGRGIVSRRCVRLDDCIVNPAINPLYSEGEPRPGFHPDCADLPYLLRGYFSYKHQLPFGFVAAMRGAGGDPRYLMQGVPVAWRTWRDYASPRKLFDEMPSAIHSGMFRLGAKIEDGDTYSVPINRASVRPGTSYYDTNGHVLVVTEVGADGSVQFIDAHPGGSITHPRFGPSFREGELGAQWGGGFRNWRPVRVVGGAYVRTHNADLRDFDAYTQHQPERFVVEGARVPYDVWVRASLRVTEGLTSRL